MQIYIVTSWHDANYTQFFCCGNVAVVLQSRLMQADGAICVQTRLLFRLFFWLDTAYEDREIAVRRGRAGSPPHSLAKEISQVVEGYT